MARLPYVDPERAPEPVRQALERVPPINIFRMTANASTAFRPWLAFGGALLSSLELDARLRELVILHVGRLSEAEYEWVQHVPIALAVGASEEDVAAVERGELDAPCLGPAVSAALRFTGEVVHDVRASDAAFSELREHLSPREVIELLLVIGQYMTVARIALNADIEIDEGGPAVAQAAARGRRRR